MERNQIKEAVNKEISNILKILSETEPGTEEYRVLEEQLSILYRLEPDEKSRKDEKKEKLIDRSITIGLELIGITLPLIFYNRWMKMGFQFERDGTFTSTTFRNLFSKFRPIKH